MQSDLAAVSFHAPLPGEYTPRLAKASVPRNETDGPVVPVAWQPLAQVRDEEELPGLETPPSTPLESLPDADGTPTGLTLDEVIVSVRQSFPLLRAAILSRDQADGDVIAARGNFDLKLKGASENGPLGFYETFRQKLGVEQPLYGGGSVFGGYRVGRGNFQPWYLERQTNAGGEFRAGVVLPLARNVGIDARRAELWQAGLSRQLAEADIRLQRIEFIRAASYAYWEWVAAGERVTIAENLLGLANERRNALKRRVDEGDLEPPALDDNRRLIASREAKLIDARRKLEQSAWKLALYYRDTGGRPILVGDQRLAGFPAARQPNVARREADIELAWNSRPELQFLGVAMRQLDIELAAAENDLRPNVDVVLAGSQDVGKPTSSKQDKSRFEIEAAVLMEVPAQRRKARGKIYAVEAKLGQVEQKRRMTADKIVSEIGVVYAALLAAYERIERAVESAKLAAELADVERRKFELGESDLLAVNLREQQSAEARELEVEAHLEYVAAQADLRAAVAQD